MKRFLSFISIALVTVTLFSCADKNKWTPETEADFKKETKDKMLKDKKITTEQADFIVDCAIEKFKKRNITPESANTPGNNVAAMQIGQSCAKEWAAKQYNSWDSEKEEKCKSLFKDLLSKSGIKSKDVSAIAECVMTKIKEQNIGPADLQSSKNRLQLIKIGEDCQKELAKK